MLRLAAMQNSASAVRAVRARRTRSSAITRDRIGCNRISARRSKSPMNDQAATLRLAVFPRSGLAHRRAARARRRRVRRARRAGLVPARLHAGADHRADLRRAARRRGATARCSARPACRCTCCSGIVGVPLYAEHKHGWDVFSGATGGYIVGFVLAAALTGCARRARLGQAVLLVDRGDADRQRRHLRLRRDLAAPLTSHVELEHDARRRRLPVRPGRHREALPRRRGAARRLDARPPRQVRS